MARYGRTYKDRVVARLLPPESAAVDEVSRSVCVSVPTLLRWRAEALITASGERPGDGKHRWTPAARLDAVIVSASMDGAARSAWCREHGLFVAELDAWKRDAVTGLGAPGAGKTSDPKQDRRRIKELERELTRKDKALAETAALLVLSKKLSAVFHMGGDV